MKKYSCRTIRVPSTWGMKRRARQKKKGEECLWTSTLQVFWFIRRHFIHTLFMQTETTVTERTGGKRNVETEKGVLKSFPVSLSLPVLESHCIPWGRKLERWKEKFLSLSFFTWKEMPVGHHLRLECVFQFVHDSNVYSFLIPLFSFCKFLWNFCLSFLSLNLSFEPVACSPPEGSYVTGADATCCR